MHQIANSEPESERSVPVTRELPTPPTVSGEKLTGYAAVYGQRSRVITEHGRTFCEVIDAGAFDESLATRNVTFVFRHNDDAEYGDTQSGTLRLASDAAGLSFSFDLPTYAHSLRQKVGSGVISGMSISMNVLDAYFDGDGVRHVRKARLNHVSPVYEPAYPQTSVKLVRPTPPTQLARQRLELEKMK